MTRAKRIDHTQHNIVCGLRELGYSVAVTSSAGDGFPDIVVGKNGVNYLFEIKSPGGGKLTPKQEGFKQKWKGQYMVVHALSEAINEMGNNDLDVEKIRLEAEFEALKRLVISDSVFCALRTAYKRPDDVGIYEEDGLDYIELYEFADKIRNNKEDFYV